MMLYAPWNNGTHERIDNPLHVLIREKQAEMHEARLKQLAAINDAFNADRLTAEQACQMAHEPPTFYVTDEALLPFVGAGVEYRPPTT